MSSFFVFLLSSLVPLRSLLPLWSFVIDPDTSAYTAANKVKSSQTIRTVPETLPPPSSSAVRTANNMTSIYRKVGRRGGTEKGFVELSDTPNGFSFVNLIRLVSSEYKAW